MRMRHTQRVRDQVSQHVRASLAISRDTQANLADAMGLSQPAISRRLDGTICWDVEELVAIADYFGTEPGNVLRGAA